MAKPCNHDSHAHFELLIGPLREVARRLGYALGVHGTLIRDIDLIACPWTGAAVSAKTLARAIGCETRRIVGCAKPCPSESRSNNPKYFRNGLMGYAAKVGRISAKPHGRKSWVFHLTPNCDGPYIDLSVMPRVRE